MVSGTSSETTPNPVASAAAMPKMIARPPASAHSAVLRSKRAATVKTRTPTTGKTTPQRTTDPNSAMWTASAAATAAIACSGAARRQSIGIVTPRKTGIASQLASTSASVTLPYISSSPSALSASAMAMSSGPIDSPVRLIVRIIFLALQSVKRLSWATGWAAAAAPPSSPGVNVTRAVHPLG